MRDFVDAKKSSLVMAFNFHAYGNLLIYPFNFDPSSSNNELWTKYPMQALLYEELATETSLPEGNIRGNAMQAIQYQANGEASDWLLGKYGILAMSPELGVRDGNSDVFFISDKNVLKRVIKDNSVWILNAISKIISRLQISSQEGSFYQVSLGDGNKNTNIEVPFTLYNKGMGDLTTRELHIEVDSS